ncbi:MAG: hypothetical protein JW749_02350 [Sedimentisphaerales bacterium]|nr:hypothetical protein [Sedimentisphaerales bacterium]
MRYFVAIAGSLIIFIGAGLIAALVLFFVCPKSWWEIEINLGFLYGNVPSLIALVVAVLAAANSFRASLRVKKQIHS